jgi:hypothetical protein
MMLDTKRSLFISKEVTFISRLLAGIMMKIEGFVGILEGW